MRRLGLVLLWVAVSAEAAEIAVPVRIIRPTEIIGSGDLTHAVSDTPGALTDADAVIGQEARVALYPGRPIRPGDVGPPAVVGRNDLVALVYSRGGLRIATEGRALGRGAVGDAIRAMNMTSRITVTGRILDDGSIEVE